MSSEPGSSQFNPSSYPVIYRGSVKDLRGPIQMTRADLAQAVSGVVFDYSEAYSVFDWGRMPDLLPKKGAALALIAADWFEKLERPRHLERVFAQLRRDGAPEGKSFRLSF